MAEPDEKIIYELLTKHAATVVASNIEFRLLHSSRAVLAAGLALANPLGIGFTHYMEVETPTLDNSGLNSRKILFFRYLSMGHSKPSTHPDIKPLAYPLQAMPLLEFVIGWLKHSYSLLLKPADEGDDVWYKNGYIIRNGTHADLRAECVIETEHLEIHK